jgi:hypothetical protein
MKIILILMFLFNSLFSMNISCSSLDEKFFNHSEKIFINDKEINCVELEQTLNIIKEKQTNKCEIDSTDEELLTILPQIKKVSCN